MWGSVPLHVGTDKSVNESPEIWRTDKEARTFRHCGNGPMVAVRTRTHTFYVDLERMVDCSEYFEALSRSRMRETTDLTIHLDHVHSGVFHSLLEFCFHHRFNVPASQLDTHLRVSTYLLASPYTHRLLSAVSECVDEHTCLPYLQLAEELGCPELQHTVLLYLSTHLLELPHLHTRLNTHLQAQLMPLRSEGSLRLCCLRKENLTSRNDPETDAARRLFRLDGSGEDGAYGKWSPQTDLPFKADKWCFTTAVLWNYLYLIGGYRHRGKRGYEFKMASFRYNPFTDEWVPTAPLIKHRRHFSAVVCGGCIYALGGWYLDSLVTPDSSTGMYTAVERYDPRKDAWTFVSSLPFTDFQFSLSLSHDSPLATTLDHCVYVLGNVQRTGEKLVLSYDTERDSWTELYPTLTRTNADIPSLYFLGATDKLVVIGGNNVETVVTSFCVNSHRWGQIRVMEKMALIGQGTVLNDEIYVSGIHQDSIVKINLHSLSVSPLPSLPIPSCYESLFHLYF
ncbi:kelch-like protein 42 [Chanos chanos]|uniref:Kelch-like protein 42 n=1 Tax=Chanos chanos TaxID=29144 RepID=A0A6J2WL97_CHACN|nr:kelch-like protein 42 [Chanos chanos]